MTERQFEELGERMLKAYDEAEQEMLRRTSKRLLKGVTQPGWTEHKHAEMREARKAVERSLASAHKTAVSVMEEALTTAYGDSQQRWLLQNKDVVNALGLGTIHGNAYKVTAILSDLDSRVNAAERTVLRRFDDVYANVIGETSSLVATGAYTQRQALDVAMQRFADRGISGFTDRAGRHWSLPAYTEMALLTSIERASLNGYVDTMQSYGYDLAVISSHAGSCPVCQAWEGVIVSVSGDNSSYPSLAEAEGAGVFHPRCLHDIYTYYPGISHGDLRSSPREIEEPQPEYTARTRQRQIEANIRKYKRRMAAAVTPQKERQAYNMVRQWQAEMRKHLADNADKVLPRKYWREGGKITLSDAAKRLQSDVKSGIVKTPASTNLQLFAEKDIAKQTAASLQRGIESFRERIMDHRIKISHPELYVTDWENRPEAYKKGIIRHWEHEIKNFEICINDRMDELKKRGL